MKLILAVTACALAVAVAGPGQAALAVTGTGSAAPDVPAPAAAPVHDLPWVDTVKDRSPHLTVPLPTADHVDGGPAVLHSVTFPAAKGEKFLVTMNVPGKHWHAKLSNAARLQCQPTSWRVNSQVPLHEKTHYNERIYAGHVQTGDEALWQMLYTAPTTGSFTCRVLAKPYGYWYPTSAVPETITEKALFTYTDETYLGVDPVSESSVGARAEGEAALGAVTVIHQTARTGRFSLGPAARRVEHIALLKGTQCERNAYDAAHPCSRYPDLTETEFRMRSVLTQYTRDGSTCRTLFSPWEYSSVGSLSNGTRGHENVRSSATVDDPLDEPGCADSFSALTQIQRLDGGGLWVEQSSTSTIVVT